MCTRVSVSLALLHLGLVDDSVLALGPAGDDLAQCGLELADELVVALPVPVKELDQDGPVVVALDELLDRLREGDEAGIERVLDGLGAVRLDPLLLLLVVQAELHERIRLAECVHLQHNNSEV